MRTFSLPTGVEQAEQAAREEFNRRERNKCIAKSDDDLRLYILGLDKTEAAYARAADIARRSKLIAKDVAWHRKLS